MTIAIITGWTWSEREVSLRSAKSVHETLKTWGYTVLEYDFPQDLESFMSSPKPEFAFIMIHGQDGEDGKIPAFLEHLRIPHQGTTAKNHTVCRDKILTKAIWREVNIPVAADLILDITSLSKETFRAKIHSTVHFPCVVKNPTEGSTIGIFILSDESLLDIHWSQMQSTLSTVLIESFVVGRELTVGILDMPDGATKILPIIEIIPPNGEDFDYKNKYNGKTTEICPADLSPEETNKIQDVSLQAYNVLKTKGYGRVDLILEPDGNIKFLEINTIPGFTDQSLFPLAAKTAGISFLWLLEILMQTGLTYNHSL